MFTEPPTAFMRSRSLAVSHPNIVQSFRLQVVCVRANGDEGSQSASFEAENAAMAGSWVNRGSGSSGSRSGRHEPVLELQYMQPAAEIQPGMSASSEIAGGHADHSHARGDSRAEAAEAIAAATARQQQHAQHGDQHGTALPAAGDILSMPHEPLSPG